MFGYEVADILLFDLETLKESYSSYLSTHRLIFYIGLALNLFLIYRLQNGLRTAWFSLALCWIFPGYFFFIREFASIYWPSIYFGSLAITMGVVHIYFGWASKSLVVPSWRYRLAFAGGTLAPALISHFLSPGSVMALGTSAAVAALATSALCLSQKGWLYRVAALVSVLWCLTVAIVLWTI